MFHYNYFVTADENNKESKTVEIKPLTTGNTKQVANYNERIKDLPAQPTEQEIEKYRKMGPEFNVNFGIRR